jgi:hypothetical protein
MSLFSLKTSGADWEFASCSWILAKGLTEAQKSYSRVPGNLLCYKKRRHIDVETLFTPVKGLRKPLVINLINARGAYLY